MSYGYRIITCPCVEAQMQRSRSGSYEGSNKRPERFKFLEEQESTVSSKWRKGEAQSHHILTPHQGSHAAGLKQQSAARKICARDVNSDFSSFFAQNTSTTICVTWIAACTCVTFIKGD